ncbi:MAG: hypothetical protein QM776_18280 [Rhodocyclaceae bacterium]
MSLRKRLWLSFGLMIALVVVLGGASLTVTRLIIAETHNVEEGKARSDLAAGIRLKAMRQTLLATQIAGASGGSVEVIDGSRQELVTATAADVEHPGQDAHRPAVGRTDAGHGCRSRFLQLGHRTCC